MKRGPRAAPSADAPAGLLGTVDDKGRIALAGPFRQALGLRTGSAVAQVLLEGALVLVPQDEHLTAQTRRAQEALAASGLTVQDLLDELPAARAAVVEEAYGPAFLAEIARLQQSRAAEPPRRAAAVTDPSETASRVRLLLDAGVIIEAASPPGARQRPS